MTRSPEGEGGGSHWGKNPVWTALRVNIFAPTFTKDLTKKERGCQWTFAWLNHFKHLSATLITHTTAPYHSHTDAFTHELQIHSSARGMIISGWGDFNCESGPGSNLNIFNQWLYVNIHIFVLIIMVNNHTLTSTFFYIFMYILKSFPRSLVEIMQCILI